MSGSKKALSSAKQSLIVFGLRESIHKSFGRYLAASVLGFQASLTESRFHYIVPPMLCQAKSDGVPNGHNNHATPPNTSSANAPADFPPNYLTTSACLAILDDLSSFACMAGDRTHRTGVSLSLSADLIHPDRMTALSEIDVLCKVDKIGRYVGFLTIEFIDRNDGKVVARGSHNKFLPTGFLWETLLSKPFFPMGFWLFNKFLGPKKYTTAVDFLFPDRNTSVEEARRILLSTNRPSSLTSPLGSILDICPVTPLSSSSTSTTTAASSQEMFSYSTEVTKAAKNYVGLMHGGAVGTVIERACVLTRETQLQRHQLGASKPRMIIDSMEVRYLAANKGKLTIEVWDDAEAAKLGTTSAAFSSRSVGVIRDQSSGKVNTQFICHWRIV